MAVISANPKTKRIEPRLMLIQADAVESVMCWCQFFPCFPIPQSKNLFVDNSMLDLTWDFFIPIVPA